jgi:hypothetical protein
MFGVEVWGEAPCEDPNTPLKSLIGNADHVFGIAEYL